MTNKRIDALLHFEDVYQRYGDNLVLDNIDLSVSEGELVTVIGPSGCGKSTLLRLVIGEEAPTEGKVLLEGKQVLKPTPVSGVVYQQYSLFPHLTILANVLSSYRFQSNPWTWKKIRRNHLDQAMDFLSRAGIADKANMYPHELSGGQRQRVAIVQTLMQSPRVLCMDEPFSALDPGTRESMQLFLLELWEELKMTVFFVTHDLEEAAYLGTRLIAVSKYYHDARGNGNGVQRGAKVVFDKKLHRDGVALSPKIKETAEFGKLIQRIRTEAFDPEYCQHVREFTLSHPDSWQTLTEDENGSVVL